ncbi:MAG: 16S rRNA (cytidine(1402)-2'-O)-methyltransferase [Steroidobacteraceae bacterium]
MAADRGRIDVVATPIGNVGDLSPRAREALAAADLVAAEDTRHTGALLRQLGIDKPLLSLHEHNEDRRVQGVLDSLRAGACVALVSDAGMPLISDPGFALVRAALDAGFAVQVLPGPSAVITALAASGLPTDRFCFEGFLPARATARAARLRELAQEPRTLVFFESPHRLLETLEAMAEAFGGMRQAAVARELSKLHETLYRGTLQQLLDIGRKDTNFTRGEITLVVGGNGEAAPAMDDAFTRRALELLSRELPPSRAAALVAQLTGRRRSEVYALVHGRGGEGSAAESPA